MPQFLLSAVQLSRFWETLARDALGGLRDEHAGTNFEAIGQFSPRAHRRSLGSPFRSNTIASVGCASAANGAAKRQPIEALSKVRRFITPPSGWLRHLGGTGPAASGPDSIPAPHPWGPRFLWLPPPLALPIVRHLDL